MTLLFQPRVQPLYFTTACWYQPGTAGPNPRPKPLHCLRAPLPSCQQLFYCARRKRLCQAQSDCTTTLGGYQALVGPRRVKSLLAAALVDDGPCQALGGPCQAVGPCQALGGCPSPRWFRAAKPCQAWWLPTSWREPGGCQALGGCQVCPCQALLVGCPLAKPLVGGCQVNQAFFAWWSPARVAAKPLVAASSRWLPSSCNPLASASPRGGCRLGKPWSPPCALPSPAATPPCCLPALG